MAGKKNSGRPERRRGVLAQYHASGLTQTEFAKREGVALSTLTYWLRRERLEQKLKGETALVAVTEEQEPKPALPLTGFIFECGDIRIEVPRDATAAEWQRLREAWAS